MITGVEQRRGWLRQSGKGFPGGTRSRIKREKKKGTGVGRGPLVVVCVGARRAELPVGGDVGAGEDLRERPLELVGWSVPVRVAMGVGKGAGKDLRCQSPDRRGGNGRGVRSERP